jgi:hypothetical protein
VLVGTIGRNDQGTVLIASADDLEEQISAMLVDWQIPEFVDHKQARLEIFVQFALEIAMGLRCRECVDDIDRGGKKCRIAAQTGGVPEGDTEMTFAQAHIGNEDHVGVVLNEAQAKEILNLWPVDLLRPTPVERVERLEHRESGQPDPSLDAPVFETYNATGNSTTLAFDNLGLNLNANTKYIAYLTSSDSSVTGIRLWQTHTTDDLSSFGVGLAYKQNIDPYPWLLLYNGNGFLSLEYTAVTAVPEPESYAMLLAGLGLLGFMARRRKQKDSATA